MNVLTRLSVLAVVTAVASAATLMPALPAAAAPTAFSSLSWEPEPFEDGGPVTRGVLDGPMARFQSLQDREV